LRAVDFNGERQRQGRRGGALLWCCECERVERRDCEKFFCLQSQRSMRSHSQHRNSAPARLPCRCRSPLYIDRNTTGKSGERKLTRANDESSEQEQQTESAKRCHAIECHANG